MTHADLPDSTKVWADGRFCCVRSGKYREGCVDPANIDALLQRLHAEGVFGDGHSTYDSFGPDAPYEVIEVRLSDRSIRLASWHDQFEANAGVVSTDHGVESLNGRDRNAVLAAQSAAYQRFRRVWSDIRSTVDGWIPPEGKPITR